MNFDFIEKNSKNFIAHQQFDVWLVNLNLKNYHDSLKKRYVLSDVENKKQSGFIFEKDKKSYLTSHVALKYTLSKYLNMSPKLIKYEFNSYGKPYIKGNSKLYFNLSHSNELACIAISYTEVGVDIEYTHKNFECLEIAKNYFTKDEYSVIINERDNVNRSKMFFKIWTMKEALLKATGRGLTEDLPSINLKYNKRGCINAKYNDWQIQEIVLPHKNYTASISYKT